MRLDVQMKGEEHGRSESLQRSGSINGVCRDEYD